MAERVPPRAANRWPTDIEAEAPVIQIVVAICPTPGCTSHYAAPDFRPDRADIKSPQVQRSQNDGSPIDGPSRIECPSCRLLGMKVNRELYIVTQVVPLKKALKAIS